MSKLEKNDENKELLVKEYKDMFLILHRIFGGVMLKEDLKEICMRYSYFNCETTYYDTINKLAKMDLLETTHIPGSDVDIIKIKKFAAEYIEGKRFRGVSVTKSRVMESSMKFTLIMHSKEIRRYNGLTLNQFYTLLLNRTTFWTKEKSPVSINNWVNSSYVMTELGKEAITRSIESESSRNSNINKNKEDGEIESKSSKSNSSNLDYTQKISFSNIRNRGGFLNALNEKPNVVRINKLIISEEAPGFDTLGKFVFDSIYLASEHLDHIQALIITLDFDDDKSLISSFNSCFERSKDERGIIKENKNLIEMINTCSKKNMNIAFKPYSESVNQEKRLIELKYKLRFGTSNNIQDREIAVYIKFSNLRTYNKVYALDKSEAMVAEKKSMKEERKKERKNKDAVVTKLLKLEKSGCLDKLEMLVTDLSKNEVEKLIKFVKNL